MRWIEWIVDKWTFSVKPTEVLDMKKHPHAEVIKQWAEGATVQYFDVQTKKWVDDDTPIFTPLIPHRVKPAAADLAYKVRVDRDAKRGSVALHYRRARSVGTFKPNLEVEFDENGKLTKASVIS